jgi:ribosomal protein S18 acetylase RimI-like enzyme
MKNRRYLDPRHTAEESGIWLTDTDHKGPVGVAYLAPKMMTQGTWNLYWIAVHPKCQKQGRGTKMLKCVESLLVRRDARIVLVETAGTEDFDIVKFILRIILNLFGPCRT